MRLFYFRRLHSTFEILTGPSATLRGGSRGSREQLARFLPLPGALVPLQLASTALTSTAAFFRFFISRVQLEPNATSDGKTLTWPFALKPPRNQTRSPVSDRPNIYRPGWGGISLRSSGCLKNFLSPQITPAISHLAVYQPRLFGGGDGSLHSIWSQLYSETVWGWGRDCSEGRGRVEGVGVDIRLATFIRRSGSETQCVPDARPTRTLATVWADQMLEKDR